MKIKLNGLFIILFNIYFAGCSGQSNTKEKNQLQSNKKPTANNSIDLQAPDLADPTLKKYYQSYTAYLKKVLTSIRNHDEAGTMMLFKDEGKQFENKNEMETKARSTPEEEQKFTGWLMQSSPYQMEIVQSEYYKKYTKEYYKNVTKKLKNKEDTQGP
ncbi:MAG: hypothetical protein ABIY51_04290 [Ferruginibacter sp.]